MAIALSTSQIAAARISAQLLDAAADDPMHSPCSVSASAETAAAQGTSTACAASADDVLEAAEHLLALQGQNFFAAQWALALRTGAAAQTIRAAFDQGLIVRSWPMRSTVHLVAAADIGWMQQVTNHRVLKDWPKRRARLHLDLAVVDQVREITRQALSGGRRLHRDALIQVWQDAGVEMRAGWSYHLVWALNQLGEVVFGPMSDNGRDLDLVLADEWIVSPRVHEGDEALAELARRYIAGHGPATAADLSWWTALTMRESARALHLAASDDAGQPLVECVGPNDEGLWATEKQLQRALGEDGSTGRTGTDALAVTLALPAFDELLLGYKDRSTVLDPKFGPLVMSKNGLGQPTVLSDGRIRGVWKTKTAEVSLFAGEKMSTRASAALKRSMQAYGCFSAGSGLAER
ncbi:winged helix DNA-binding domain-containing protein [Pseudoclavibacter sp. CFCC 11306]|uniref:winged helix DNA-binding domain-containing protein n=1 Tax=Pseudoclavibacter sp. CFCC 11306 TaxID=1564493 RepID=UPI001300DC98|nr:winged helix DNA-binding domain-containing protein [Pseudoclavibacter sp. CFCC 11306]KAB1658683.1 winged helix DNA-binding domain-containing protein [Pseudoclavibacter sp. CFCC 11306]